MEVRCKKLAPSSSSCFITNLPTPILMDILCGLPIKTLTACKIVCKSWLHLSRDPHFAQLHQARAPTEFCFQHDNNRNTIKLHMGNFHCLNALFELSQFSVSPAMGYRTAMGDFNFSNSCNGLLCYHGGDHSLCLNTFAVVWNPCTSESITLPALATPYCCRYGLGFSRKTNKYKLLRLVDQGMGKSVVAEICTIEKGCSWNALGPCPSYVWEVIDYCTRSYKDPTFLHNTLHWHNSRRNSDINIFTFNFEDDQFGRVPFPPSFDKTNSRSYRVGELLGCLFITEYTNEGMNIWLMKEYGVEDSWTKMYSLSGIVMGNDLLPVTCMDNSEILLADVGCMFTRVFSYNPDQEDFRLVGPGLRSNGVIAYKPSLVSLKDSMFGYKVHVSALKPREMSTSPDWWSLHTKGGKRKGRVKATSESSVLPNVSAVRKEETEKKRKVVEPLKKQIALPKQHNQRLEKRLQAGKAKVKQHIQQNQQLEERLKKRTCKGKAAGREVRQSKQLKEEI